LASKRRKAMIDDGRDDDRDDDSERVEVLADGEEPVGAGIGGDAGAPGGMGGPRAIPGGGRPDGGVSPVPADEGSDEEDG
jgi:hypothetical protein